MISQSAKKNSKKDIQKIEYFEREFEPVQVLTYSDGHRDVILGIPPHTKGYGLSIHDNPISHVEYNEMIQDKIKEKKIESIRKKNKPSDEDLLIADKLEKERRTWREKKWAIESAKCDEFLRKREERKKKKWYQFWI
jgi:hypothetical protein